MLDDPDSLDGHRDWRRLKTIATLVYALQALSIFLPIIAIVGVIISYVWRAEAQGTWVESHFSWQIRSFWYEVMWVVIGLLTVFLLIGYAVLLAASIWFIYRVVKGWLNLAHDRPMYADV